MFMSCTVPCTTKVYVMYLRHYLQVLPPFPWISVLPIPPIGLTRSGLACCHLAGAPMRSPTSIARPNTCDSTNYLDIIDVGTYVPYICDRCDKIKNNKR